MNALKMCLNWKVLAGVAAVGAGLLVFAPGLAAAALPFLVLAICPLSMVFMMGAMNGMGQTSPTGATGAVGGVQQPRNRNERLAELEMQQQALANQIATLEAEDEARLERRPNAEAAAQPS